MFVERFEELNVTQNAIIKLHARVIGNPVPEVLWLHNNTPLQPSDRVKLLYDGENIELIVQKADSEIDSGDYKCIASNIVGKASHGAKVSVDVDKVKFTRELKKSFSVEETQMLTLECETSHTVSTKWFFNDKELTGMDHRIIHDEGRTHKLVIKNATLSDIGKYTCTVKKQSTQTTVEVLERKPEFVRTLQDYEAIEKQIAIFEVELTSSTADVTWFKDGIELDYNNANFVFEKDSFIRKLTIKETSVFDEGEYTCVLPDHDCTAELIIMELPPEIITHMKDIIVTKGDKATFEIELTKGDAWVRWFKGKEEIQFSDHIQLSIDGKRQRLKIYQAQLTDADNYSCEVGQQISTATLTVEEPTVEFIKRLPDVTLSTKNSETILIVELSMANVELIWFRNKEQIKPDSKYIIEEKGTLRQLTIKNTQFDDESYYHCVCGNVKSSTQLKVEGSNVHFSILNTNYKKLYFFFFRTKNTTKYHTRKHCL